MSDGIALNLDTYKKAARTLRKAHVKGDTAALSRVAEHIPESKSLRHADFLHVVAREAGYESCRN